MLLKVGRKVDKNYSSIVMKKIYQVVPEIIDINEFQLFLISGSSIILREESQHLNESLNLKDKKASIEDNEIILLPKLGIHSDTGLKVTQWVKDCHFNSIHHVELGKLYDIKLNRERPLNLMESTALSELLGDKTNEMAFMHYHRLKHVYEGESIPSLRWFNLNKGSWLIEKFLSNYGYDQLSQNVLQDALAVVKPRPSVSEIEMAMLAWYLKSQKNSLIQDHFRSEFSINSPGNIDTNISQLAGGTIACMDDLTHFYHLEHAKASWVMSRGTYSEKFLYSDYFAGREAARSFSEHIFSSYLGVRPSYVNLSVFTRNYRVPGYERTWETASFGKEDPGFLKVIKSVSAMSSYFSQLGVPIVGGSLRIMDNPFLKIAFGLPIISLGGGAKRLVSAEDNPKVDVGFKLVLIGSATMARIPLEHLEDAFPDNKSRYQSFLPTTNAELQRRCQALLNRCAERQDLNPIADIIKTQGHGLTTAMMNYLKDKKLGAMIQLRAIPAIHPGINLCELLTHEISDRYLLVVNPSYFHEFKNIADRESCPYQVVGDLTADNCLVVDDEKSKRPVAQFDIKDYDNAGSYSISPYKDARVLPKDKALQWSLDDGFKQVVAELLQHPNVGNKAYVIHRVDSSVGGLVAQDALVGPNQLAVSDCSVMLSGFDHYQGVATALGECPLLASLDEKTGTFLAINEAITNLLGVPWKGGKVELAVSLLIRGEKVNSKKSKAVIKHVRQYAKELAMKVVNVDCQLASQSSIKEVEVPAILVEARTALTNVNDRVTPMFNASGTQNLYWVNLNSVDGFAGSAFAEIHQRAGAKKPGVPTAKEMKSLISTVQTLHREKNCAAFHDVSSGGVLVTLIEMFMASMGADSFDCIEVEWPKELSKDYLFSEGTGVVIQVNDDQAALKVFKKNQLVKNVIKIASIHRKENYMDDSTFSLNMEGRHLSWSIQDLYSSWHTPSYLLQKAQDGDILSQEEKINLMSWPKHGLALQTKHYRKLSRRAIQPDAPKAMILRERGGVGFFELAEAFIHAGFVAVDVSMDDVITGRVHVNEYSLLAVAGGSSYGDALKPGSMWATKILMLPKIREQFVQFFKREDTLVLGVGNGAQMVMLLHQALVGDTLWPSYSINRSDHFESRLACVRVESGGSPWLAGMNDQIIALPIACSYGRITYNRDASTKGLTLDNAAMRFVNKAGGYATSYPDNPTGSDYQIASMMSNNGRVLLSMGHPERAFLTRQFSWAPPKWQEYSPWFALFDNAYDFVMKHPPQPPGY